MINKNDKRNGEIMKYIIDEEELKKLVSICCHDSKYESISVDTDIKDFLKPKQSIELVASGVPMRIGGDFVNWSLNQKQDKEFNIYIEEVEK